MGAQSVLCRLPTALELLIAAQMPLTARHELARAEWFRDIVVRPEAEATDFIHVRLPRRDENDRDVRDLPQLAANIETVEPRQHEVKHHEVIATRNGGRTPACAIIFYRHGEARRLQIVALQLRNVLVILHDEDFLFCHMFPPISPATFLAVCIFLYAGHLPAKTRPGKEMCAYYRASDQGNVIMTFSPAPSALSAWMLPCIVCTICRTMARPRPLPPATSTRALSVR